MTTYCVNLNNKQVTEYTDYDALAYERIDGKMYAVTPDGIYLIDNGETLIEDDDGITVDSYYAFGETDFGDPNLKRMLRADVGAEGNVNLLFNLDDKKQTVVYDATHLGDGIGNRKIKVGKGYRSRYWQPAIKNVLGANFEVDSIELEAMITGRRVR